MINIYDTKEREHDNNSLLTSLKVMGTKRICNFSQIVKDKHELS